MELKALEEEVSKKLENLKSTVNGSNGSRESFKEIFNDSHKKLLWCERHLKTTQEAVESKYPIEFNEGKEHVITRNVDYS